MYVERCIGFDSKLYVAEETNSKRRAFINYMIIFWNCTTVNMHLTRNCHTNYNNTTCWLPE